jgi:hypothetical protein
LVVSRIIIDSKIIPKMMVGDRIIRLLLNKCNIILLFKINKMLVRLSKEILIIIKFNQKLLMKNININKKISITSMKSINKDK